MSDDLPERVYIPVRSGAQWAEVLAQKDPNNAEVEYIRADRIEELEAKFFGINEEDFMDAVWEALKSDCTDLRRQQKILDAFRTTIAELTGGKDE